ncbi:acyltransferase family protein [Marimonas lutisalis]|uniref:acyltransferase family protein n=1 Tax=Marimonas lutisalis TaxID=2545756 RepID=UPI0022A65DE1|nr:acyltransferase family protein [Marimonas lutisalis]
MKFAHPRPEAPISTLPHPAYRPEIDGLRMIAVLAVVLYHFGVPGLPGGFTGVDVFFVISGFLIGGILWRDLTENDRLHLGRFYIRRVKRLAPAYFAMAAVTSLFAFAIFLPFEYREFGKSLIAATLYLSNVLFWRGEGYFDIGADNKALLHTWSLSVEEQFYIALPILILLLKFSRPLLIWTLIVAFAGSLAASVALTPGSQTTTFYLFPFRAWELLAGVLLAIYGQSRGATWAYHAALSWLGLALVLAGILFIRPQGFPGWQAILPALGTALLIANGKQANPVNHVLSMRLPVFFGKISYSLYLWHWPVLVLSKYWRDGYSGWSETAGWMALALVLSILSWWLVETPFRRVEGARGKNVLVILVACSLAMFAIGWSAYARDGMPERFGPDVRPHISASADFLQDTSRCAPVPEGPLEGLELCVIGPTGPPRVVIWGDSHLRALMDGLGQLAQETGTPGVIYWHAGCMPLVGVDKSESYATPAEDAACTRDKARMFKALPTFDKAQSIILVGRWSYYVEGRGTGAGTGDTITLSGYDGADNAEVFRRGWEATLPVLEENFDNIHVLRQVPEIVSYDSREVARRLAHGRLSPSAAPTSISRKKAEARAARAEAVFAPAAQAGRITVIDPWPRLCDVGGCYALEGPVGRYFDNNHLTNTAARQIRDLFAPAFRGEAPQ